jgi:hypothetical protein
MLESGLLFLTVALALLPDLAVSGMGSVRVSILGLTGFLGGIEDDFILSSHKNN